VARDRGSHSPLSDHHRATDRSRTGLGKCDLPLRNRRRGELPLWVGPHHFGARQGRSGIGATLPLAGQLGHD
jgi:hypothetical protein